MIKSTLTPPTVDQATIDHYVAKGSRERSQAFRAMFRDLFRIGTPKPAIQTGRTNATA